MTQALTLRSAPSGPVFVGDHDGDALVWDATLRKWKPGVIAGGVTSFDGRTGAVVPQSGDYDSDQVVNVSTVPGFSVSDALEYLLINAGAVDSVFTRVGNVTAQANDYTLAQIDASAISNGASLMKHAGVLVGVGSLEATFSGTGSSDPGTDKVCELWLTNAGAGSPVRTLLDATGKAAGLTVSIFIQQSSGAGRWAIANSVPATLFTQPDAGACAVDVVWNGSAWSALPNYKPIQNW